MHNLVNTLANLPFSAGFDIILFIPPRLYLDNYPISGGVYEGCMRQHFHADLNIEHGQISVTVSIYLPWQTGISLIVNLQRL